MFGEIGGPDREAPEMLGLGNRLYCGEAKSGKVVVRA